jgi:hypothetical protein
MKLRAFAMGLIVLGVSLLPPAADAAAPAIGRVSQMTGKLLGDALAPGGAPRKLAQGDQVFAGERIRTGAGTVLHIEFTDKSRFVLGPNTEFEVGRYSYGAGGAADDAFHSRIIKGAFRFVTGLIAQSRGKDMKVSVSVATIGIRGTQVEGEVSERQEKEGRTVDASARVALLEPEKPGAGSAILVENKFGSVVIDKPGYGTEIPDEKSPPSPVKRMQLRTIDNVMRAIRTPARTGGPAGRP